MNRLRHFPYRLLVAVLLSFVGSGAAVAADATSSAQPIHIEADRMESFEKNNEVLFSGRVEATQGDIVLHADEMRVDYAPAEGGRSGGQKRQVDKLFAKGNVKVVSKAGWVATGKTMDYFAAERKAILIGDAKVWQDNNLVTGNRIVLYLDEGKSVVESDAKQGEGGRVKAFLYPGDDDQEKEVQGSK